MAYYGPNCCLDTLEFECQETEVDDRARSYGHSRVPIVLWSDAPAPACPARTPAVTAPPPAGPGGTADATAAGTADTPRTGSRRRVIGKITTHSRRIANASRITARPRSPSTLPRRSTPAVPPTARRARSPARTAADRCTVRRRPRTPLRRAVTRLSVAVPRAQCLGCSPHAGPVPVAVADRVCGPAALRCEPCPPCRRSPFELSDFEVTGQPPQHEQRPEVQRPRPVAQPAQQACRSCRVPPRAVTCLDLARQPMTGLPRTPNAISVESHSRRLSRSRRVSRRCAGSVTTPHPFSR